MPLKWQGALSSTQLASPWLPCERQAREAISRAPSLSGGGGVGDAVLGHLCLEIQALCAGLPPPLSPPLPPVLQPPLWLSPWWGFGMCGTGPALGACMLYLGKTQRTRSDTE